VTKEWHYRKKSLAFFLAFKQSVWPFSGLFSALFGFLLKFSSGNPGLSPTLNFEARFRRESQLYRVSQDMRNCEVSKW